MNKYFCLISLTSLIAVVLLGWVVFLDTSPDFSDSDSDMASSTATTTEMTTVNLYYYRPQNDIDESGTLQCSVAGLVPVTQQVEMDDATAVQTLQRLLSGGLTQDQRLRGFITEFPLPGLKFVGLRIDEGVATVALDDPKDQTGGSVCRANILRSQIEETIRQFPGVAEVRFLPETLFRP